jgi:RNase adaptor protein for sRNA GlmZ degradation
MGAYGYRGFYERKTHFLQSVPYALRNLEHLLGSSRLPIRLPALWATLEQVVRSTRLREVAPVSLPLTVRIESFSYKKGMPADASGHGGGFVFDCRLLPNPGREERFKTRAGDEPEVRSWLDRHDEVRQFFSRTDEIVTQAVESYRARSFTHLSVAFGCTGGQHRSVYGATLLAARLRERAGVQVELRHRDVLRPAAPGTVAS